MLKYLFLIIVLSITNTYAAHIELYTAPGCGSCQMLKQYMNEHNIKFTEHCIDTLEELEAFVKDSGSGAVPKLKIDGQFVGSTPDTMIKELEKLHS